MVGHDIAHRVARVADGAGAVVVGAHELHRRDEARLVHCRHEDHLGEDPKDADITEALVHSAVAPDEPRPVQAQPHGQRVQGDLLEHLVERPLQERRVDGEEGLEAGLCEPGHHVHGMGFADAGVPRPVGEQGNDLVETGPVRHRRRAGDHAVVALHDVDQRVGKGAREASPAGAQRNLARVDLEGFRRVECRGVALGVFVALALDRMHVQHHRAVEILDLQEHVDERRQVVPVNGPDRHETELLEPGVLGDGVLGDLAEAVVHLTDDRAAGQVRDDVAGGPLDLAVRGVDPDAVEVCRQCPLGTGDGHAVVVEDDEELPFQRPGVVHPLHGDAVDDARVAHQGAHVTALGIALGIERLAAEQVAACHAHGGRDGGSGVADREEVIRRLARIGEAGHAPGLAKPRQHVGAAGDELVRVALVPDVEQEPIVAEVEDVVQSDGEFDDAEVRREVTAGLHDLFADRVPDLGCELRERVDRHRANVGGARDAGQYFQFHASGLRGIRDRRTGLTIGRW